MKTLAAVFALMLIAGAAQAVDIQGKWGIGAVLFNGRGTETSLIRGHSNRTAWLLDVSVDQFESTGQGGGVFDQVRAAAGPRLRRYTRPAEDFSPYWDLWTSGLYEKSQDGTIKEWGAGVAGGVSMGLEYFTRWHFSVAVHSDLASGSWLERHYKVLSPYVYLLGTHATTTHFQTATLGLRPQLVLRAWF